MDDILLDVQDLTHCFRLGRNRTLRALDGVSFQLRRGEIFGLVGESGSGKSTAAKCIMNILRPTAGKIRYLGVNTCDPGQFRSHRKLLQTSRQIIFQDSTSSLNPRMTVAEIIAEPLVIHRIRPSRGSLRAEAAFQLKCVGMDPGCLDKRPPELSGGQRQRTAIARALGMSPELLVADEPIASLDVSIQAQIINLLEDLQKEYNLTYLFISHALSVVRHISDRVMVMYLGRVVEFGSLVDVFDRPSHPYTRALLRSVPVLGLADGQKLETIPGATPNPADLKGGCEFADRCEECTAACRERDIPMFEISPGHRVRCLKFKECQEVQ